MPTQNKEIHCTECGLPMSNIQSADCHYRNLCKVCSFLTNLQRIITSFATADQMHNFEQAVKRNFADGLNTYR